MIRNTSIQLYKLMESIMKRKVPSYELGRWNSHIKKKEAWEYYVDMANYDNCCCSFNKGNKTLLSSKKLSKQ